MAPIEKKRIAYFYDSAVGDHVYELGHPMKPFRVRLTHSLVTHYGLHKGMEVFRAQPATSYEMTQFHTDDYVNFLRKVTPDNMKHFPKELEEYNVGVDSPIFDGLFEFCGISAGGSMEGAGRLNRQRCDIAINWAGGLHHAKKGEASGFCYINDAVLGILELLRFHKRVLYIDIDVHHGDGVEEAFYTTDRVMTVSLHKYGEFFPGTGDLRDIGVGNGKYHSINVPLRDGIDDLAYKGVFEPVISAIMKYYQPEAVVLQCGADSLSGDRLGPFNLSMAGHANCVTFVQSFRLPTLVLGGGGYTIRNVARAWAFETGELLGLDMDPVLPYNEYYSHYGPDFELDVKPANMANLNSPDYLSKITAKIIDYLRSINPVPSVELTEIPPDLSGVNEEMELRLDDEDEDDSPDVRNTIYRLDKRIAHPNELESDSDDDFADFAYNIRREKKSNSRRRNRTNVDNPKGSPSPSDMAPPAVNVTNGTLDDADLIDGEDAAMFNVVSGDGVSALEGIVEPAGGGEEGNAGIEAAHLASSLPASPTQEERHSSPARINGEETDPVDT